MNERVMPANGGPLVVVKLTLSLPKNRSSTSAAAEAHHISVLLERHDGQALLIIEDSSLGPPNKEVAARLEISVKTVEAHKANAMAKLGLKSRIDIVRYALLQG